MTKEIKDTYVLFSEIDSEKDFISTLNEQLKDHLSDNVVVDISALNISENNLKELNNISDIHKQGGMSFVVVVKGISPDDVEETFTICPTLQEAEDIIVMENLERELGF